MVSSREGAMCLLGSSSIVMRDSLDLEKVTRSADSLTNYRSIWHKRHNTWIQGKPTMPAAYCVKLVTLRDVDALKTNTDLCLG